MAEDLAQYRVVTVSICVVRSNVPLQVIRPGIFVRLVHAKRTGVTGGFVNQTMPAGFIILVSPDPFAFLDVSWVLIGIVSYLIISFFLLKP